MFENLKNLPVSKFKILKNIYNNKKLRKKLGLFITEGLKNILEIDSKYIKYLIIEDNNEYINKNFDKYSDFFSKIDIYKLSKKDFNTISSFENSQGILALTSYEVLKIINNIDINEINFALFNIQDPNNLGAILRNLSAFDFNTVILDNCVDIANSKVIRSSMGAVFKLNFVFKSLIELKKEYPLLNFYGFLLDKNSLKFSEFIKNTNELKNIVFIFGNEGHGLPKEIIDILDRKIFIEMSSNIDSLNVSVSTGIVMYNLQFFSIKRDKNE